MVYWLHRYRKMVILFLKHLQLRFAVLLGMVFPVHVFVTLLLICKEKYTLFMTLIMVHTLCDQYLLENNAKKVIITSFNIAL